MVKQERATRTRQTLIRAAAEVFAREGFAQASLTTISRQAGVSNGALHFHFTSKNALAQAVEEEAGEAVRLLIRDVSDRGRSGALQNLVDATHGLMNRLANDVVVRAGFELYGDVAREGGFNLRQQWQQWVEETLKTAEQEDVLAHGVSPRDAAHTIVAATVGFEVLGSTDTSWLSAQSITSFWELMLPRLAAEGALGKVDSAGSAPTVTMDEEPAEDVSEKKTDRPV